QLAALDVGTRDVRYLVITHSHFDHCGAVPYLKRRFPEAEVVASAYAAEVLGKPRVIDVIASANKEKIDALGLQKEFEELGLEFGGVEVDRVVGDGDAVDLGQGIEAHFIEAPGHSKCSMAVYVPALQAVFPSDAAPCPLPDGKGLVVPSPQYDFPMYVNSLRTLSKYDVEICAFEHHGVLTGEQAKNALQRGLQRTERFRNHLVRQRQELGDIEKVAQKIATEIRRKNELPFLSLELQATITKISVRKILGA
ncbi:MAG: MBL fold metallo-hydrolase, partial [Dehalococcoidia bacterium]